MKKQIFAILTCLVMCSVFLFSEIQVNASTEGVPVFYFPMDRPATSINQGYITVLAYEKSTGNNRCFVISWSVVPIYASTTSQVSSSAVDITISSSRLALTQRCGTNSRLATMFSSWNASGTSVQLMDYVGTSDTTFTYTPTDYTFKGYITYGNYGLVTDSLAQAGKSNFICLFGNDGISKDYLEDVINLLIDLGNDTNTIISHLNAILTSSYNVESKLNKIIGFLESSGADKETIEQFQSSSSTQTDELNSLNQQTHVDKIDVDSASQTVDENLSIQTDVNYGVLLSTFTSNDRILTMLLLVASVSLISFVLFGKR